MSVNGALTKENSFVKNRAKLFNGITNETRQSPSYVTLSCSVNGYSGYTCYDSKVRQEIRSRDSSRDRLPLCITRSRDPSPKKPGLSSRLSSGFLVTSSNGVTTPPGSRMLSNRSKSVDRTILRQNFLNGCADGGNGTASANWHKSTDNLLQPTFSNFQSEPVPERGRGRHRATTAPPVEVKENKSLIQQRIERLYGPGALARSFLPPKTPPKGTVEANNNSTSEDVTDFQRQSPATPPVFRHLNPEFRQQLFSPKSTVVPKPVTSPTTPTAPVVREELPGDIFLKTLEEQKKKLESQIRSAEEHLSHINVSSSEEFTGKIHAAVGKCRLLMAQKFEQFAGLCRKNLHQSTDEPFPTTGDDLAGFWDMVTIQVEHIYTLFNEIDTLSKNGWQEVTHSSDASSATAARLKRPPQAKSSRGSNATSARSAKAQEAAKAREEARKRMMEEKRRLMKEMKAASDDANQSWIIEEKATNGDLTNKLEMSDDLRV